MQVIDFLSSAAVLNYGHNDRDLLCAALQYLQSNGIVHGLDMATSAKREREFMEHFDAIVLRPRGLTYKFQFPRPTGANAVEAALKLARKTAGRQMRRWCSAQPAGDDLAERWRWRRPACYLQCGFSGPLTADRLASHKSSGKGHHTDISGRDSESVAAVIA